MNTGDTILASDLLVNKKDMHDIRFVSNSILKAGPLENNELLMKIDCFAFTSNNITYGAVGQEMQYWDFFPAEEGWGRLPCWGFADVIASKHESISEGERIYGYFPMSSHLRVKAGKVNEGGFYDVSGHRLALPIIYNHYIRTKSDPSYNAAYEGLHSLFQPLFATSFLLDDYMAEADMFGAQNILLTSASSKTAIALAFLLKQQKSERSNDYRIIGLTSYRNQEFVQSLGLYDDVISYDSATMQQAGPSIVVDFAGNKKLLLQLQSSLGEQLKRLIMVGLSHWEDRSAEGHIEVANEFFFAPAQAEKRTAEWGGKGLRRKMADVYIPFLTSSGKWLQVRKGQGNEAVEEVYQDMVMGKVNPSEGWILSLSH